MDHAAALARYLDATTSFGAALTSAGKALALALRSPLVPSPASLGGRAMAWHGARFPLPALRPILAMLGGQSLDFLRPFRGA